MRMNKVTLIKLFPNCFYFHDIYFVFDNSRHFAFFDVLLITTEEDHTGSKSHVN